MATPLPSELDPVTDDEVFLELVLGDPDLLQVEFAAITGDEGSGQLPPEASLVVAGVRDPLGPAVLKDCRVGTALSVAAGQHTRRRGNRQRSPPRP